jgi:hypothetical protein
MTTFFMHYPHRYAKPTPGQSQQIRLPAKFGAFFCTNPDIDSNLTSHNRRRGRQQRWTFFCGNIIRDGEKIIQFSVEKWPQIMHAAD